MIFILLLRAKVAGLEILLQGDGTEISPTAMGFEASSFKYEEFVRLLSYFINK